MNRILLPVWLLLLALACREAPEPFSPAGSGAAPLLSAGPAPGTIPGRFIVTLREDAGLAGVTAVTGLARQLGATPDFVYSHALTGFAGSLPQRALQALLRDPRVLRVEPDGLVRAVGTQTNPPWGLDRIDQRAKRLNGTFGYDRDGRGVTAYVIDTGIRFAHSEFGGRARALYDAVSKDGGAADCNGHGTHVAGTIGGVTYGVAKRASLLSVRVLDCGGVGSWSGVIAGIDAIVKHHSAGAPAVANLSLGGGPNQSADAAVRKMIADGVATAIAAGNDGAPACDGSPGRVAEAMTIGATDRNDTKPWWSNYGSCVDWFAPGVEILSAAASGNNATDTMSGTSMAAPHTAGVAALFLQKRPAASPRRVRDVLYGRTTQDIVKQSQTANDHLLFTSF